jgi:hypothetical protein
MTLRLEDVFKTSGVPTYTFVEPKEYTDLIVGLRTPGRGIVVEGPSGIGKTTAVHRALDSLGASDKAQPLSARRADDLEIIDMLPSLRDTGVIIIDDFHKLDSERGSCIADFLKLLADEERADVKLIIIGINQAGDSLIRFAEDITNRIDIIRFEHNPDKKVDELIRRGEEALNIRINVRSEIVISARGSFYIAQMLCSEVCKRAGILERQNERIATEVSFEAIKANVWDRLSARFRERTKRLCSGTKFRREGRAPYLHLLYWLATESEWSLSVQDITRSHPDMRGSVGQVVEKGYLKKMIEADQEIAQVIHFEQTPEILTIEDPQYIFYVRNIPWSRFARELGYTLAQLPHRYDFALSFAGEDRKIAESLVEALQDREVEVFYDKNEQFRILAEDVEEYLRPIYQSEAAFVIAIVGPNFPMKVWTRFESEQFQARFAEGSVIPVVLDTVNLTNFDRLDKIGRSTWRTDGNQEEQAKVIAEMACRKLDEKRRSIDGTVQHAQRDFNW